MASVKTILNVVYTLTYSRKSYTFNVADYRRTLLVLKSALIFDNYS